MASTSVPRSRNSRATSWIAGSDSVTRTAPSPPTISASRRTRSAPLLRFARACGLMMTPMPGTLGVCPGGHDERGKRAGEREREAQRRPTRCGARDARRELVAAGGRSEQPSGSAAIAALPRLVGRSRHDYPDSLLGRTLCWSSPPLPLRRHSLHDVFPAALGLPLARDRLVE